MADLPLIKRGRETIGSFVAACLAENDVETVFGIPGTHNIEIYRGLQQEGIQHVLTRHEQGATYAADGYARATGRAGVVVATSGPGVTNCITGIANAYADSIPLLVVSPGAPRGDERRDLGLLHEAKDQRAGIDRFADASIRVESQTALEAAIHGTFHSFLSRRPRPVHIEIPTDLIEEPSHGRPSARWLANTIRPDSSAIFAVAQAVRNAERPLIVVGGGAVDDSKELTALVNTTGIPVVTTVAGKGVVSEHHNLSAGAGTGGSLGFSPTRRADLILAFATELKNTEIRPGASIARFDIDPAQLHKHHRAEFPVLGDAGVGAAALTEQLHRTAARPFAEGWVQEVLKAEDTVRTEANDTWLALHGAVIRAAQKSVEPEAPHPVVLTGDSSQVSWQGTVRAAILDRPRSFLTTDGYATLGYSLPSAIGAKIAHPEANVVALLGDGALMFSVQELITAAEQNLPIPVVVIDNGGYGEIEENMRFAGIEPFAVALTQPEYAALAAALRCRFAEVGTPDELEQVVRESLAANAPTLIRISQDAFRSRVWRAAGTVGTADKYKKKETE